MSVSRRPGIGRMVALAVGVAAAAACASAPKVEPATLVLDNGKIVTVDDAKPEAQAVAVRGATIVAVGTNEEIKAYIGPATQVVDLQGHLAVPGLIEGHGHFTGVGQAATQLKLAEANTWDDIVSMVADAVPTVKPGEWVLGRGWHQEKWTKAPAGAVEGFPLHDSLSKVSPDNPVLLTHASGHATFANAKAMQLAGITRSTPNPPGGEILRDAKGNAIGVFRETASGLLRAALQKDRAAMSAADVEAETRKFVDLANREVTGKGITSFQDAGAPFSTLEVFKKIASEGKMTVRLWAMVRDTNEAMAEKLAATRLVDGYDKHLTIRAIKHAIDGALGPRGAWLLSPYDDLPSSSGLNTTPVETIAATAALAMTNDYQLCVHAIGDRANRETLDVFEAAMKAHPEKTGVRWRVEHAQHISAADIPRFGQLGVIASMQGIHCTSDAPYVLARLGAARAEEGAYVWQKLMKSGAIVSNGTDAPVENVDPIPSLAASVTRKLKDGSVFFPDQRMSRAEALKSYTLNAAYAAFEEHQKGSIVPGKLADIVVLSKDIMTVPEDEIVTTKVTHTIIGGQIVYQRDKAATN
ncbi:MAG: amidohydrolase [Vicinamibacterales bacterium]